jgi:hypothetical protein
MAGDVVPDFRFVQVPRVVPNHQGSHEPATLCMDHDVLQCLPVPFIKGQSFAF